MITTVEVIDFRNIARAFFELSRINVVTGPNEGGKSSLLAAIEWGITRRNTWTDGAGKGSKTQVRHGRKTAHVKLQVGKYSVDAQCPPEPNFAKKVGQLYLCLGMGQSVALSEQLVQAHLRACELLALPGDEQKSLLCRALRLELDNDNFNGLVNALDERWPDLAEWFDEQTAAAPKAPVFGAEPFLKFCQIQRPATKRILAEQRAKVQRHDIAVGRQAAPTGSPEQAAEARIKRDDLVRQIAEIEAAGAPAVSLYTAELKAWEALSSSYVAIEHRLERAKSEQAEANSKMWGLAKPEQTVEEFELARSTATAEVKQLEADASAALTEHVDFSSICGTGECRAVQFTEQRKKQTKLQEDLKAARARKDAAQLGLEAAMLYRMASSRVEQAGASVLLEQAALDGAPAVGEKPAPPTSTEDPRLAQLHDHMAVLDGYLEAEDARSKQAMQYQYELDELATAREREDELIDEVERWECLCRAFDTHDAESLPSQLLAKGLPSFLVDVDAACRKHFGFGVEMDTSPWGIWLVMPTGRVPSRQACGGEEVFLSAVLQVELARRTGFPIIMLDEAQRLDAERRPQLARYLLQHKVQAIIAMAAQEKTIENGRVEFVRPTPPDHPDVAYFWMENGAIERITKGV